MLVTILVSWLVGSSVGTNLDDFLTPDWEVMAVKGGSEDLRPIHAYRKHSNLPFESKSATLRETESTERRRLQTSTEVDIGITTFSIARADVNRNVFGVNFLGTEYDYSTVPYPLIRWGGNSNSRFNWVENARNSAHDWYFIGQGIGDSWQDRMGVAYDAGLDLLVQIPAMGWVSPNDTKLWSFSVEEYGAQTASECTGRTEEWWECDAGNGVSNETGEYITGNDPYDASENYYPSDAQAWVTAIRDLYGDAASRFQIDNEPGLWHETHRDVHPDGASYDEVWNQTLLFGTAVKETCPTCEVFGYNAWGWCGYWTSGMDKKAGGCTSGDDRDAHGGLSMIEWYLQQAAQFETDNGYRLLDYLNLHYYPQASNVAFSSTEDETTIYHRLALTRGLWDSTYTDETWINTAIEFIPTIQTMIDNYYPGTKIAICEYNWGNDDIGTGAIAQAEVLAIYATYGVDLATRWVRPDPGSFAEDGFNIYLDYDGSGSSIFPTDAQSVDALTVTTSDVATVTAYAFITTESDGDTSLYIMAFNKAANEVNVTFALDANASYSTADPISIFGMDISTRLDFIGVVNAGDIIDATTFSLTMPAYSARLSTFASDYIYEVPTTVAPATTDASMQIGVNPFVICLLWIVTFILTSH